MCSYAPPPLQAVGASERVFQLLDRRPTMAPGGSARPTGAPQGGDLLLKDVWCALLPPRTP